MSIDNVLREILAVQQFAFPKDPDPEQDKVTFGDLLENDGPMWKVKCSHRCNPPASETKIRDAEQQLGFVLPAELDTFLRAADGAELFVVPRLEFDTPFVGYRMLGTEDLVALHNQALDSFRYVFSTDPYYQHRRVNYIAFCDVNDGNYLAILLEGPGKDKVFFLDREGCFRPYTERNVVMYYTVADSLEEWFALLRDTGGGQVAA
jgi:hypothetical protein